MAELKRDRVNRVTGLVHLKMDSSRIIVGQRITLEHVVEEPIDCAVRDAMAMREPRDGNAIGDALFDAQTPVRVLGGISRGRLVAFCTENGKYLGTNNYIEKTLGYVLNGVRHVLVTEKGHALGLRSRTISTNVCDAEAL